MTVAVASHQRREPLLRLLRELDAQAASAPELGRDLQVVVVLDGSTDGSKEAVEAERWHLPVRVHWQANRGLASARNVGLEAAGDGLVWFLDDDLVPTAGLLERHRTAHDDGPPSVVVGASTASTGSPWPTPAPRRG
jgi:glycosyltransferase involved in cell wall biosynthesis